VEIFKGCTVTHPQQSLAHKKNLITHPSDVAGRARVGVSTNNVFSFGRFKSRRTSFTTTNRFSDTKKITYWAAESND